MRTLSRTPAACRWFCGSYRVVSGTSLRAELHPLESSALHGAPLRQSLAQGKMRECSRTTASTTICSCYFSSPLLLNIVQRPLSRCNSNVNLTLALSYWKSALMDALQRLGFRHF